MFLELYQRYMALQAITVSNAYQCHNNSLLRPEKGIIPSCKVISLIKRLQALYVLIPLSTQELQDNDE